MKEFIGIASRGYLTVNKDNTGSVALSEITLHALDEVREIIEGKVERGVVVEKFTFAAQADQLELLIANLTTIKTSLELLAIGGSVTEPDSSPDPNPNGC